MIDMSMTEDDEINCGGIKAKMPVQRLCLGTKPLKKSAVEQKIRSRIGTNQMLSTCYRARCAMKCYLHLACI